MYAINYPLGYLSFVALIVAFHASKPLLYMSSN
jgi:hypothetical protein